MLLCFVSIAVINLFFITTVPHWRISRKFSFPKRIVKSFFRFNWLKMFAISISWNHCNALIFGIKFPFEVLRNIRYDKFRFYGMFMENWVFMDFWCKYWNVCPWPKKCISNLVHPCEKNRSAQAHNRNKWDFCTWLHASLFHWQPYFSRGFLFLSLFWSRKPSDYTPCNWKHIKSHDNCMPNVSEVSYVQWLKFSRQTQPTP